MAYNPFLSMFEPAAQDPFKEEPVQDLFTNAGSSPLGGGGNPFAASNPFSDFGGDEYEPPVGDTVPVDIFGPADPTGIGAKHFDGFETNATMDPFGSQVTKPTELDLISTTADEFPGEEPAAPARPLPPETQNLILSVTGQMEFTSSHLLDRIPPTRTPSPVSARDIHSPCPTPEPDLLEELPVDSEPAAARPARPAPARPPAPPVARPPPPRPAPPPVPQQPHRPPPPALPPHQDEINLFDAPVPVSVKPTKEAIMSLYSAPKKEKKEIDFLSDDILENMSTEATSKVSPAPVSQEQAPAPAPAPAPAAVTTASEGIGSTRGSMSEPVTAARDSVPTETTFKPTPATPSPAADKPIPMDCSEPGDEISKQVSKTSPFADTAMDDFPIQSTHVDERENNPFEHMNEMEPTSAFEGDSNIFNIPTGDAPTTDMFGATESTQFDDGAFAAPESSAFGDNNGSVNKTDAFCANETDAFGGEAASDFGANSTSDMFGSTADAFADIRSGTDDGDMFGAGRAVPTSQPAWGDAPDGDAIMHDAFPESQDAFDAFSAKFESTSANHLNTAAWGDEGSSDGGTSGFEAEAFDPFLSMGPPPPPAATPRLDRHGSRDSTDDSFSVFIRPKENEAGEDGGVVPVLAPPPRPQAMPDSPRVNPFDKSGGAGGGFEERMRAEAAAEGGEARRDSGGETPPTPLFDEDVSMPLEEFPRVKYDGPGWEMYLRQPNKKKITGQRFWKKVFVRVSMVGENPAVQLYQAAGDKEPFQELPLQACYSVSETAAQQFDQFGKIFTVKLQYVFYKERPGVRPGQVTKAERITTKLSQFAAYAIQGDYAGVKEFGSDLRKLGLPVEHAPQISQLFKLGSLCYEDVKQFAATIEEHLFRLAAHRDRALTYKMEEVQITAVDELYVEQDAEGSVLRQIARVRVFFLGFLSGMPDVELGINDLRRQGREVVGRHDIIPVVTEEWIRVEAPEFHACVTPQDFTDTQIIKFKPPDACYIELMRFRIRPPKNRELPLQLKATWCVTGNKVELRADVLVPGFASRKLGQVPCEDVAIRFPIPECWIYLFRVEKHFRYGSVKSAHRRTGKIKGIERFLGAVDTLQESLIEVTSGQAKYEHQHRAIVWRMPRLPKEGQGAYTTHNLVCRMALTSYDQVPEALAAHAHVEFTMPATTASHVTVRSVSLQGHDGDPPEKYVRYLARHEYRVGIERTAGGPAAPAYAVAAKVEPPPAPAAPAAPPTPNPPSSDSDSD